MIKGRRKRNANIAKNHMTKNMGENKKINYPHIIMDNVFYGIWNKIIQDKGSLKLDG